MKTSLAKKAAYLGAGAGLVLFGLFGLLPGSLLGGAVGLNIAGWMFGMPLEPGLMQRGIVIIAMLFGVLAIGVMVVTATSTLGWIIGRALDKAVRSEECDELKTRTSDTCY